VPTLLVVDDEVRLRELYAQELEYMGYEVVSVQGGPDALAAVKKRDIDVVVLDIAMPGMDGIETLAKILAVDNQLPVILCTGYASYQDDFMTWAAEAYVVKSSDLTELVARIEEALLKHGITPPPRPGSA
jgi:DNA-binding response OmpR family regulator